MTLQLQFNVTRGIYRCTLLSMIEALASVFLLEPRLCGHIGQAELRCGSLQRISSKPKVEAHREKIQRRRQCEVGVPHRTYSPASSVIALQPVMMYELGMCLIIFNMTHRLVVNLQWHSVGL